MTLQSAVNAYCQLHVTNTANADAYAATSGNREPNAQRWMRSGGLTPADWQIVNKYLALLRPRKSTIKRLKGRGTYKRSGSLAEVIPVFETFLSSYEEHIEPHSGVDYDRPGAPGDHAVINLRAACAKEKGWFIKLDNSPAYYSATSLHPAYIHYYENASAHTRVVGSSIVGVSDTLEHVQGQFSNATSVCSAIGTCKQ